MKLDFSHYHPLSHRIFSRACFGWYGGPVQHIKLWWKYERPGWDKDYDWDNPLTLEEASREAWPDKKEEGDESSEHKNVAQ